MSATSPVRGIRRTGTTPTATWGQRLGAGIIGGLAGGVVFGVLLAMMDMLPMIAAMVGSSSAAVGFIVHLIISVIIGLGLTIFAGGLLVSYGRGAGIGLLYGALWWVLGPLLLMPLFLGMPILMVDAMALWSLLGHLVYGLVLGLVAVLTLKKLG